jgi:hypothetical protein
MFSDAYDSESHTRKVLLSIQLKSAAQSEEYPDPSRSDAFTWKEVAIPIQPSSNILPAIDYLPHFHGKVAVAKLVRAPQPPVWAERFCRSDLVLSLQVR